MVSARSMSHQCSAIIHCSLRFALRRRSANNTPLEQAAGGLSQFGCDNFGVLAHASVWYFSVMASESRVIKLRKLELHLTVLCLTRSIPKWPSSKWLADHRFPIPYHIPVTRYSHTVLVLDSKFELATSKRLLYGQTA
jgi:hypothetical protein